MAVADEAEGDLQPEPRRGGRPPDAKSTATDASEPDLRLELS